MDAVMNQDPWWECDNADDCHQALVSLFKEYVSEDHSRLKAYDAYSKIYVNRDISQNDYLASYNAAWSVGDDDTYSRVPVNLAKVMVDAAHARVTRQNPRPVFVTRGGDLDLRERAEGMQKWVEYCEHFTNARPMKKAAYKDAMVYGDGFLKTSPHPVVDEIVNERVHPSDIFVDPVEASTSGVPTHMYQRAFVSRSRLKKYFEKHAAKIQEVGRITDDPYVWNRERRVMRNMVEVVEAWRLPSYKGAGDGKHAMAIANCLFFCEEWEGEAFPFAHAQWKPDPTIGFFGVSLVEELIGIHYDFNHTLKNVEECIDMMPTPIITAQEGTVQAGKIANVNGLVLFHTDRPPSFQLPPSVPTDVLTYSETVWTRGLEVARLLSMSMPDKAGNQFETGAAVRDFNDIQATELAPQYECFEAFNVQVYENEVRAGNAIYKRNPSFSVVAREDKYTVMDIPWEDIRDPRTDSFIIQVFPASMLSQLPASRKQDVLDYYNAGWLDDGEAMDLLDFPDLQSFRDLRNAARDNVKRILTDILKSGEYTPPEPTLDLRLSLKMTQMFINRAQVLKVPEERVALLRQFARQVHGLMQESQDYTRAMQEGAGPGPMGGPPAVSVDGSMPTAI